MRRPIALEPSYGREDVAESEPYILSQGLYTIEKIEAAARTMMSDQAWYYVSDVAEDGRFERVSFSAHMRIVVDTSSSTFGKCLDIR